MTSTARTAAVAWIAVALLTLGSTGVRSDESDAPIVVELFTSQGCSSCPPADRLLTRLGSDGAGGGRVIPLSFHVDYWNYIGWTDPFSSEAWSDRQRRYVRALGHDTLYTPALVIHGASQVVGAGAREILSEIARARRDPSSSAVRVVVDLEETSDDALTMTLGTRVDGELPQGGVDLIVAVFEERLVTRVARGENARRELRNDYVVRKLVRAFGVEGGRGAEHEATTSVTLEPDWNRGQLGIAALAQDPRTLKIYGATATSLR